MIICLGDELLQFIPMTVQLLLKDCSVSGRGGAGGSDIGTLCSPVVCVHVICTFCGMVAMVMTVFCVLSASPMISRSSFHS